MLPLPELTADERNRYEWQLWVRGFGEEGQRRLKATTVFVSRIGGVGGTVAMLLAAAGVGRLVLAHAGDLRLNDLNRQLLMTTDWVGRPRIESAVRRLRELNPHVAVETVDSPHFVLQCQPEAAYGLITEFLSNSPVPPAQYFKMSGHPVSSTTKD